LRPSQARGPAAAISLPLSFLGRLGGLGPPPACGPTCLGGPAAPPAPLARQLAATATLPRGPHPSSPPLPQTLSLSLRPLALVSLAPLPNRRSPSTLARGEPSPSSPPPLLLLPWPGVTPSLFPAVARPWRTAVACRPASTPPGAVPSPRRGVLPCPAPARPQRASFPRDSPAPAVARPAVTPGF
jgi:hypothetical protein